MIDFLIFVALLLSMVFLLISLSFNWENISKGLRYLYIAVLLSGMFLLGMKLSLVC